MQGWIRGETEWRQIEGKKYTMTDWEENLNKDRCGGDVSKDGSREKIECGWIERRNYARMDWEDK